MSDRYTHGHEAAVLASHGARTAATSAAYLLPHLRPGMTLLDIGCGPGTITLDLAAAVTPGRTVGLENTPAPLVTARANGAERGDATTEFVEGDAYDLPLPDDSFDVVHAHQVLQHLTDPVAALREMARVARPGGLVAVRDADYAAMAWYPESAELDRWLDLYRSIARGNGAEPDAGRRLRAWAQTAGLRDIEVSTTCWTYATPESAQWWGDSQAARVSGETFVRQACEHGADAAAVAAIAAGWQAWGRHPDAWFVIPSTEVLARA